MINRLLCPQQSSDRFLTREDNHIYINLANLRETKSKSADCEGSWRRMYVTQPPSFEEAELFVGPHRYSIPSLFTSQYFHFTMPHDLAAYATANEHGLLGDLADMTTEAGAAGLICSSLCTESHDLSPPENIIWERSSIVIHGEITFPW